MSKIYMSTIRYHNSKQYQQKVWIETKANQATEAICQHSIMPKLIVRRYTQRHIQSHMQIIQIRQN